MDNLIDDVARILATPMPRRRTFKLLGGVLAAALVGTFGGVTISAQKKNQCTDAQTQAGMFNCGNGVANQICCPPGTCCSKQGNNAMCCTKGQCICKGTCSSSTGGGCPKGCEPC
jgi:hypothetical protein